MRRIIVTLAAVALSALTVLAQDEFKRTLDLGFGAGASYTYGSDPDKWSDALSFPTLSFDVIYNITPVFSLRGDLYGNFPKAAIPAGKYSWHNFQLSADAMFNVRNFWGYDASRIVNPYVFAGFGVDRRTSNHDAIALRAAFPTDSQLWKNPTTALAGRVGIGSAFRLGEVVSVTAEIVDNILPDGFNSYEGKDIWSNGSKRLALDNHVSALVGLRFTLGVKRAAAKAAAAAAAEAAAAEAAAKAAAARAAAEKKAAEEKAAAEAAAAEAAAKAAEEATAPKHVCCRFNVADPFDAAVADEGRRVFFKIGSDEIQEGEQAKIDSLADELRNMDCCRISVIGYADAATGTVGGNLVLSKHRAVAVANAFKAAGIPEDRVLVSCKGDFEQVEGTPEENRMALIVVECLNKCE